MGLAASQGRFLSLTARKSDIEFKGQQINQTRTANAYGMEALVRQLTNESEGGLILDPTNPAYIAVNAQIELRHSIDRNLELDLKNVDTQHNEVQTEIDAVKKVVDKNVEMTFKTFA